MPRTIAGPLLAFALVIAPSFYCAQGRAHAAVIQGAEKAVQEAVPKIEEKLRELIEKVPEPVKDVVKEGVRHGMESIIDCLKENPKEENCKAPSKKELPPAELPTLLANRHPNPASAETV